jgi:hypothetical protein
LEAVAVRLGNLYVDTARFPEQLNAKLKIRIDDLTRKRPIH